MKSSSIDEEQNHRNWNDLIPEILHKICQQHIDPQLEPDTRRRIRAVCTTWRASVPLKPVTRTPRIPVPNSFDDSSDTGLYLVENTFYHITPLTNPTGSSWLVRAEPRGPNPNLYRMRNPYIGNYGLFYMFYPTCITSKIDNLLDYQVREVHRSITLKRSYRSLDHLVFEVDLRAQVPLRKLITSQPNNDDSTRLTFTALGLTISGFLVFWRAGDAEWTKLTKFHDKTRLVEINDEESRDADHIYSYKFAYELAEKFALFVDIAIHNNKCYAIEMSTGNVYEIDLLSITTNVLRPFTVEVRPCFTSSMTRPVIDRGNYLSNCSLVECKGFLYYIHHAIHDSIRCNTKTFFVLKDDQHESEWEFVEDGMADQVIYLLGEASFVVPASDRREEEAGVLSAVLRAPDDFRTRYMRVHIPLKGRFQRCAFRKPAAGNDDDDDDDDGDCSSIFFPPPPWVRSYYRNQGNAPVQLSELFDS